MIRTEPKEGVALTQGQTVTLWISKGKKVQFGSMPNVVGEEKTNAQKVLEQQEMDLKIVIEEVYDMTTPAGIVMETTPGRGEKLKTGQTVTVKVSKGIEKKVIPDLVGMEADNAKGMLTALGFKEPTVKLVDSDKPKNTVVAQSLEKEKEHEITASITLEVSNGSKAPVTKDVTIDLRNSALYNDCQITISRGDETIYSGRIPKGTLSVTLPKQTGVGSVVYTIKIGEEGWDVTEVFSANG